MSSALQSVVHADLSYIPPQRVTICSIFPGKVLPVRRPLFNKKFEVPKGTKAKPEYMVVEDCHQRVYHGEQIGERLTRVLAEQVANDIINEVTLAISDSDAQEDAFPGIFICKGERADAEELAIHGARQERFMKRKVNVARELHRLKMDSKIDENYRVAAQSLGIRGEEWQGEFDADANTPCPWCKRMIPADAKKCAHCAEFTKPEYALEAQGKSQPQHASK